jgi:hypothetical protein
VRAYSAFVQRRAKRAVVVVAVLSAVAAGGACGGGQPASDGPKAVVRSFYAAVQNRDGAKACGLLDAEGRTAIVATAAGALKQDLDCAAAVSRGGADAYLLPDAQIGEVTGLRPALTVVVRGSNGDTEHVMVVKYGDRWRIAAF